MDNTTAVIRYQQWIELFREWSASGLNKKQFCKEKNKAKGSHINEYN